MPSLPDDFTTELAAVNTLLSSVGEASVASVDPTLSVDVGIAIQILNEIGNAIQVKGWSWNREEDWELAPSEAGEIALPANCLSVANAYWCSNNESIKVSQRAGKLYNRAAHSFVFPGSVAVDAILKLAWEDLPEYVRQAITQAATEVFQVRLQGTSIVERSQNIAVQTANALLEQREDEDETQNMIGGNKFVSNTIYGGPRRRLR